jgi:hypothetical protein
MGMYVAVRGWLEVDHRQRPEVEQIIRAHDDGQYSGGWAFPAAPFNWTLYVFYGGDLRESGVDWLRDQVSELARLTPVDADEDLPAGFFLLSDERQRSTAWTIRDGTLAEAPAPPGLHWFAHRP